MLCETWRCPRWSLDTLSLPPLLRFFRCLANFALGAMWVVLMLTLLIVFTLSWGRVGYYKVSHWCTWLLAHLQERAPWVKVRYYRLGQTHRSSDGHNIRLAMRKDRYGSAYSKPKMIDVMYRRCSWHHVMHDGLLQSLWLLILMLVFCSINVAAVRVHNSVGTSHSLLGMNADLCPSPLPYHTGQILAWCVTEGLSDSFRCRGWGPP